MGSSTARSVRRPRRRSRDAGYTPNGDARRGGTRRVVGVAASAPDTAAVTDDDAFLAAFESCAIDHASWTHRCHVRMAYLYLVRHGYDAALVRIRDGIHALNASHGDKIPKDKVDRGYHETLTVAWTRIIAAAVRQWGAGADFDAFAAEHPHLLSNRLLRLFYSRGRLMNWDAKRAFVEPDLLPLPPAK
jgi:hypothetical protein